jgi:hypothetical protein
MLDFSGEDLGPTICALTSRCDNNVIAIQGPLRASYKARKGQLPRDGYVVQLTLDGQRITAHSKEMDDALKNAMVQFIRMYSSKKS